MAKYKAVTHLQDIHGTIITPDQIVESDVLGDQAVIDHYLELEAIAEPTAAELKAEADHPAEFIHSQGSIVTGPVPKDVKESTTMEKFDVPATPPSKK